MWHTPTQWPGGPTTWPSSPSSPPRALCRPPCSSPSKLCERFIHGRIAPHILPRLDETQGGFRWGADALVYSLVDTLRLRQETILSVRSLISAIDTASVKPRKSALLRWVSQAACGAQSPIFLSVPFHTSVLMMPTPPLGSTLASLKGRVFSPLLFNLLVAADIRRCCPGVRLHHSSCLRFVCQ